MKKGDIIEVQGLKHDTVLNGALAEIIGGPEVGTATTAMGDIEAEWYQIEVIGLWHEASKGYSRPVVGGIFGNLREEHMEKVEGSRRDVEMRVFGTCIDDWAHSKQAIYGHGPLSEKFFAFGREVKKGGEQ